MLFIRARRFARRGWKLLEPDEMGQRTTTRRTLSDSNTGRVHIGIMARVRKRAHDLLAVVPLRRGLLSLRTMAIFERLHRHHRRDNFSDTCRCPERIQVFLRLEGRGRMVGPSVSVARSCQLGEVFNHRNFLRHVRRRRDERHLLA